MIKIMLKYYSIKEIVTWAPNDILHQNNARPKTSPIDCDGVLLTNVHPYYDVENTEPYNWKYNWNQTENNNSIKSSNRPAWPRQLVVCMSLKKS